MSLSASAPRIQNAPQRQKPLSMSAPVFHMHCSSTLLQRHQKPLSASALGIPHASFFSLPQRHQKPLSASALGIPHASFFSAPAASSIVTFRKCHPHSALLFFYASAASSKPLSASAIRIQYAFSAPTASHRKPLSASALRIQYALSAPVASHQKNHYPQVNTESRMHRSSTLPQCHVKSHFP